MIRKFFIQLLALVLLAPSLQATVKAVVFDFGGVIANVDRSQFVGYIEKTLGVSDKERIDLMNLWKQALSEQDHDREFWQSYLGTSFSEEWYQGLGAVKRFAFTDIPGMLDLVQDLKAQGVMTPMLSNVDLYHSKVVRELGYYDHFDPVLLSCDIGVRKPSSEAYQILLDQLQLAPSEVVFIDDQIENVEAARMLGIEAIHFLSIADLKAHLTHLLK